MVAFHFYLLNQDKDLHVANFSHGSPLQCNSPTHSEQRGISVSIIYIQNFSST